MMDAPTESRAPELSFKHLPYSCDDLLMQNLQLITDGEEAARRVNGM